MMDHFVYFIICTIVAACVVCAFDIQPCHYKYVALLICGMVALNYSLQPDCAQQKYIDVQDTVPVPVPDPDADADADNTDADADNTDAWDVYDDGGCTYLQYTLGADDKAVMRT